MATLTKDNVFCMATRTRTEYPVASIVINQVELFNIVTQEIQKYDIDHHPSDVCVWRLGPHTLQLEKVIHALDTYTLYTLTNDIDAVGWVIKMIHPLYYTKNGVRTNVDVANSESHMYTKEQHTAELIKLGGLHG